MSSVCIRYLLLPDLTRVSGIGARIRLHPLLSYAAKSWPLHYRSQGAVEARSSREDALALCCAQPTCGYQLFADLRGMMNGNAGRVLILLADLVSTK
ncbi:hypothetical protein V8C34DRAFT_268152 [Trichoderma compactum]